MPHLEKAFEIIWRLISASGTLSDLSFGAHHSRNSITHREKAYFTKAYMRAEPLRQCITANTSNFNLDLGIRTLK